MLRIESAGEARRYWVRRHARGGWPVWLRGLAALGALAARLGRRLARGTRARTAPAG